MHTHTKHEITLQSITQCIENRNHKCDEMQENGKKRGKNHSKTKQESGNETQSKDETRKFHISLSTVKDELLNVFVEAAC